MSRAAGAREGVWVGGAGADGGRVGAEACAGGVGGWGSDTQAVLWSRGAGSGREWAYSAGSARSPAGLWISGRPCIPLRGLAPAVQINSFLVCTVRSGLRNGFTPPVWDEPQGGGWETLIIIVLQTRELMLVEAQ